MPGVGRGSKTNPQDGDSLAEEGYQMTVLWHVDDLIISCKNNVAITKLLVYLRGIYGNSIAVHWGHKHDYIGMDLDFSENGVFKCSMILYRYHLLGLP